MKTLADLAAPAVVVRKLLEADVQRQCVDWARARGYWARKFSSIAQRSVPDYLFSRGAIPSYDHEAQLWGDVRNREGGYGLPAVKFACEFKAPGKTSTDAQRDEQEAMRLAGWFVFECDNFEKFKATVIVYEKEHV